MATTYKGKVVPEPNGYGMELNCHNSHCYDVRCEDCINFPLGDTINIKHEYLLEMNKDEYIQEGLDRLSDV